MYTLWYGWGIAPIQEIKVDDAMIVLVAKSCQQATPCDILDIEALTEALDALGFSSVGEAIEHGALYIRRDDRQAPVALVDADDQGLYFYA